MICPTCKQSIHCPVCASDLPSAAPAAPLTDERIIEIRKATPLFTSGTPWENSLAFARAIEQAHGIGGGK